MNEPSCDRYALHEVAPGMSHDMVQMKMGGEGVKTLIRTPGGGETSAVDYPRPSSDVYVEYDHPINRRPRARVVRVRVSMDLVPATVETLVRRFGRPDAGADELFEGLDDGTAVWVDDNCGVVVTAYRPSASWWAAEGGTRLQVETLDLARRGDSPASSKLKAILAGESEPAVVAAPEPPIAMAIEEPSHAMDASDLALAAPQPALESPMPESPAAEDGVDGVDVLNADLDPNAIEASPPPPAILPATDDEDEDSNGVVVPPPAVVQAIPIVTQPSRPPEPPPGVTAPTSPQTIATWRASVPKAPDPQPPSKPASTSAPHTIATWRSPAAAGSIPSPAPRTTPSQPQSIATWRPAAPTNSAQPSLRTVRYARPPTEGPAERITFVPPVYPPTARWLGVNGRVTLVITVRADGTVASSPYVLAARPTGRGFEDAAIDAVQNWRFRPAMRAGIAVQSTLTVDVDFE